MSNQKQEYVFGKDELDLTFEVESRYSTNEELPNVLSIVLECWTELDCTEPGEHYSIWQEPLHEDSIWQEPLLIDNDIWHEPVYNDYEIWQEPNDYTDTTSEIFQCNFDQTTAENDSQTVSQEELIDEFFIIEKDPATINDLRYYSSRDDIIEPELVDQFNSPSPINKEVAEEGDEKEFIDNLNDWINFDSLDDHIGFFNSCKLSELATEI